MARQTDFTSRPGFVAEIMRTACKPGIYFIRQEKKKQKDKKCLPLHTYHSL
jgi:hypothetical protein